MKTLEALYNIMPLDAWLTLVFGPAASLLLSKLKRWLGLQSERVVVTLFMVLTGLGGIGTYLITSITLPPTWIVPFWGMITSLGLAFYHLLYKPGIALVSDAKKQRESELTTPAPVQPAVDPWL